MNQLELNVELDEPANKRFFIRTVVALSARKLPG